MIKSKKLIWQIFPGSILTILLAVVAVSWYGIDAFQAFHLQETESDLKSRASLVRTHIHEYLDESAIVPLRKYCIQAGRESGTRITVINRAGKVLADSNEDPDVMDNHGHRVEIVEAFKGGVGVSRRYSKTLDERLVYVALPLFSMGVAGLESPDVKGSVEAVVRTSLSVASLDKALFDIKKRIALGALAILVLAGIVTLLISRNISKPLEQMTRSAEDFSKGNFSQRMLPIAKRSSSLEIVTLAGSMDRMAELLDDKIQTIVTQRNQLQTVFSSMVEAVIAIDKEERVIKLNEAAADFFEVDVQEARGKIIQQIVRNTDLLQQIHQVFKDKESVEGEIVLRYRNQDRFLQTHVVTLSNGAGENIGVLVVMNDVTKLRKLEAVRRDFVANVSHELRTPITSIRGYVETLLDGAIDNKEDAVRFLEIVLRQSGRLSIIIDDLLVLSRIEEEARQRSIVFTKGPLSPVIDQAIQTCMLQADRAGVSVQSYCPETVIVEMNETLIEQAVLNLLINAITYSKEGDTVTIETTEKSNGEVQIIVSDTGCGIPKQHVSRLFERFYRIDPARSRKQGGTGLGLAIVKHIVQAHDGRIDVDSMEGKGTTFTITLNGSVES